MDHFSSVVDIHGARAASLCAKEHGPWITELKKRRPANVAIVAMANKLARTMWAIMSTKVALPQPGWRFSYQWTHYPLPE